MKAKAIMEKQAKANVPYTLALAIRALLDEARNSYPSGKSAFDEDDVEGQVSELVFSDEE